MRFFLDGRVLRQPFAGVPENAIAEHAFVDRKIACKHTAPDAERFNQRFKQWPPGETQRPRVWRGGALCEGKAHDSHTKAADLHAHVWPFSQSGNGFLPRLKGGIPFAGIRPRAERPAAVVHNDVKIGQRICQRNNVIKLGVVNPDIQRKSVPDKAGCAFAKCGSGGKASRGVTGLDTTRGSLCQASGLRSPRKRPPERAIMSSMTGCRSSLPAN